MPVPFPLPRWTAAALLVASAAHGRTVAAQPVAGPPVAGPPVAGPPAETRHQVGVEVAEFFKLFEEVQPPGAYALAYRWTPGGEARPGLRAAASFRRGTGDDGALDVAARVGVDRAFVRDGRWRFTAGVDALALASTFAGTDRRSLGVGVSPVAGFRYHLHRRFSVSTEPRLIVLVRREDDVALGQATAETRVEVALGGIGQLQASFHF